MFKIISTRQYKALLDGCLNRDSLKEQNARQCRTIERLSDELLNCTDTQKALRG